MAKLQKQTQRRGIGGGKSQKTYEAHDPADLEQWVRWASAGARCVYWRGFLCVDRHGRTARGAAETERLARVALRLWYDNRVHLVQKRMGYADYLYLAIKR